MSQAATFSHGIAGRYATAVFDIARDAKSIDSLQADITALDEALGESPELRELIASPLHSREDQGAAMMAISKKMGLSELVANTIGLMASKRRLFVLPALVASVKALIAQEKGEVTAEVTSAKALTKTQTEKLAGELKKAFGTDIVIKPTVDESIIGGLIVKVGSKMIDTSIASKLSNLQNAMKEVG